jgi:hypothetical protein
VFNTDKKSEAMKRLTLHRIASSFIASLLLVPSFGAQLQVRLLGLVVRQEPSPSS